MITPEPPAGSEHYREGWRHGYEQAAIDRERSADAVSQPPRWPELCAALDVFAGAVPDTGQADEVLKLRWEVQQLQGVVQDQHRAIAAVRSLCADAMKLPTLEDPRPADDRVSPRAVLAALDRAGSGPDTGQAREPLDVQDVQVLRDVAADPQAPTAVRQACELGAKWILGARNRHVAQAKRIAEIEARIAADPASASPSGDTVQSPDAGQVDEHPVARMERGIRTALFGSDAEVAAAREETSPDTALERAAIVEAAVEMERTFREGPTDACVRAQDAVMDAVRRYGEKERSRA